MGPDSSVLPNNKTRGNSQKLKFHLNMRKNFFTVRMTEHWKRLGREVVKSPSLEVLKIHMDVILSNLLQVALAGNLG